VNLQIVGCSHHQSNVAVREQLAFSEQQIKPFLKQFYRRFPQSEAVLLSTCNRTEIYTASKAVELLPSQQEMMDFLAENRGVNVADLQDNLFTHRDRPAIRHLFSVAASLDSMVVGESQILAQVKRAYQLAAESHQTIPLTHQVFQSAIRVARRISNETEIHASRVSVPSVAVGVLAKQIFERLDNKKILILGAGEMAEETLRYVQAAGGRDIVVVNRTRKAAEQLAAKFEGRVTDWDDLQSELRQADLIVSTTGATQPVVTTELFESVDRDRNQRTLFILDLAIPRDFDSEIGNRLNVYLYTLDDLQRECERNRQLRRTHFAKAETILDDETELFFAEINRRSSGETIAQLKQQADEVKMTELKRLLNKIDLEPAQQKEIEQSFNRLVNKILHPPLKSISDHSKEDAHHGLLEALKRLFQLGD
jgi:glutamyl-tRNA reductase